MSTLEVNELSLGDKPFYVRHNSYWDLVAMSEVCTNDFYGLKTLDFIPEIVLDVGAHIGCFCRWCKIIFPKSHITAFEPHPTNFLLLSENVKSYDIKIRKWAISGGYMGLAKLAPMTEDNSNFGGFRVSSEGNVDIWAEPIIEHMPEHVDLLKLDCEGAETEILLSLERSNMLKNIKMIVGEVHSQQAKEVIERLGGTYEPYGSLGKFVIRN